MIWIWKIKTRIFYEIQWKSPSFSKRFQTLVLRTIFFKISRTCSFSRSAVTDCMIFIHSTLRDNRPNTWIPSQPDIIEPRCHTFSMIKGLHSNLIYFRRRLSSFSSFSSLLRFSPNSPQLTLTARNKTGSHHTIRACLLLCRALYFSTHLLWIEKITQTSKVFFVFEITDPIISILVLELHQPSLSAQSCFRRRW